MTRKTCPSLLSSCGVAFRFTCLGLCLLAILLSGCRSQPASLTELSPDLLPLQVTSPSFQDAGSISAVYTCDGSDISPQLDWNGIPENTVSLVMIADDPDAPLGTWVHWVLYDLPPELTGLPEAAEEIGTPGMNSFQKLAYGGPCPPKGSEHRYYFKLYALDVSLTLEEGASKADVEKAMQGHILAQGQLMGKYRR